MGRQVEILDEHTLYQGSFFRLVEARLRHERFDGRMSDELVRISFERGDSATVILHDPGNDTVMLVEQYRYPTSNAGFGWLFELPAGIVEKHESGAIEATIRRELLEETGYVAGELVLVSTFFPSPGASSERIFLFHGGMRRITGESHGGGRRREGEDIRTVVVPLDIAFHKIVTGEIVDAKTIIGLQWLRLKLLEHSTSQ